MSKLKRPKDILNYLENVDGTGQNNQYMATCPAHQDSNPSLSVKIKKDKVLIDCKADCPPEAVVNALGLDMSDLSFNGHGDPRKKHSPDIVETYDYRDEYGDRLFQVCRKSNKDFPCRRKVDGDWDWSITDENNDDFVVKPVLYHLPEVMEAKAHSEMVFVVEGEKDADNLRKQHNLVATCNPMGAGSWKDLHTEQLRGAKAVVIPDADEEGMEHGKEVADKLLSVAATVKLIEPGKLGFDVKEKHGKDVSDWLQGGGTAEELLEIVESIGSWEKQRGMLGLTTTDKGGRSAEMIELVEDVKPEQLEGIPTFPIEAVDEGVIGDYVNWLDKNSEEPPSFSFAAYRNLLGLAVGRELTISYGGTTHAPVFFDVLIGKSSLSRKSNTINTAHDIIDHSLHIDKEKDNFKTINGIGSAEGMLQAIESTEGHVSGDYAKAVLLLDEFSSITDKVQQTATQNLQSQIIELWDLKSKIENITKNEPISIERPTASILAGTTVENIKGEIDERVRKGGFFNRFCWWTTQGTEPVPFRDPMPKKLKNKLKTETRVLIDRARGRKTKSWKDALEDDAEKLWKKYYKDFHEDIGVNRKSFAIARQPEMTVRHALLFSLLHEENVIKKEDLLRAIEIAKYLKNSAFFVLGRFERDELDSCQRRILDLLREEEKMKKSELSQRTASYCGGTVAKVDSVLDDLEEFGHIRRS